MLLILLLLGSALFGFGQTIAPPLLLCNSLSASSTAYTCTPSAFPSVSGQLLPVTWTPDVTNTTTSPTLDLGFGAKLIKDILGNTILVGAIVASSTYIVAAQPDNTTIRVLSGGSPGGSCTVQFVRSINYLGVPTCASIASNDLAIGIVTPSKMGSGSFVAQTDGATITWDIDSILNLSATILFTTHGGSRTLNIQNPKINGNYVIRITQDSTGGEGLILGTGCTWKVINGGAGAITLSTGANAIDVLAFTYDGTNCLANLGLNYN